MRRVQRMRRVREGFKGCGVCGGGCGGCRERRGDSEAWGYVGARAAKAVDGLVVVTHRGQRDHAARRQQLQQLCSRGAEAQRYWRRRDADAREAHVWWEQTCNCRSLVSCVSSTKMCE